ncbi:MAG: transporter [Acidobacteriaceae bacterium]
MNTPRLEQKLRADVVRQQVPGGHVWIYDNGKGLDIVPARHIALIFNLPPYLRHSVPNVKNGFGDVSFLMKYRLLARNEAKGNYVVTALLGASVPTGSYKNGSDSATIAPSLGGGKGWGRFNMESTLGGVLPVDSDQVVGRSIVWNSVAQYHIGRYLWPELESNATYFRGGPNDGKAQNFITPGLLIGRIHFHDFHDRMGLTAGMGMQFASSQYHAYNHGLVLSVRVPF